MDRRLARTLEAGVFAPNPVARAVASVWAGISARSLVRPGVVDARVIVVSVGGATLGGSGKTRLAIACARALAERGARVVFVGHAYRARPGKGAARVVGTHDALAEVGDEALVASRALAVHGVEVVVASRRQDALDHAVRLGADVLVVDGPLRLRDVGRRSLSLLAVDAEVPWGAGHVPPAGDLRAPTEALLAEADHVVPVSAQPSAVWIAGEAKPLAWLAGKRVGLFTALARPDRLVRGLEAAGIAVARQVAVRDHGGRRLPELDRSEIWGWLATEKCALHHPRLARDRAGSGILRGDLALPASLVVALGALT